MYQRTDNILINRYKHYLISTILTAMAGSLNGFVDSFVVSRLLGSKAMSIVNMCNPVMFIISMIYCAIGIGGSIMYAEFLGKMDRCKAGGYYRVSLTCALALSIVISITGLSFINPISYILCGKNGIYLEAVPYLRILFVSTLPIIIVGVLSNFIIVSGKPNIATAVNIISNVVNICMDYVYIHFFGMRVEGAALATLTGCVVALIFAGYCIFVKKNIDLEYTREKVDKRKSLADIVYKGLPSAVNQLGFSVKILFCNNIAMALGGILVVTVYSVCMQTITMVSVVLCGTLNAMYPILALIKGQGDNEGVRLFIKKIYRYQLIASIIMVGVFFFFSKNIMILYNVPIDGIAFGDVGFKIFAFTHLFRPLIMIFMSYMQTVGMKTYAFMISMIDGVVGIPIVVAILTHFIGIDGLWFSFPLTAVILLVGVLVTNLYLLRKSHGDFQSLLLLPADEKDVKIYEITIPDKKGVVSDIARQIQRFCEDNGCDKTKAMRVAIACEEICQYTIDEDNNKYGMDIIAKIYTDKIELNIRSLGKPFNHMNARIDEKYSNVYVLYKMVTSVTYDYVMGMNQTKIVLQ